MTGEGQMQSVDNKTAKEKKKKSVGTHAAVAIFLVVLLSMMTTITSQLGKLFLREHSELFQLMTGLSCLIALGFSGVLIFLNSIRRELKKQRKQIQ